MKRRNPKFGYLKIAEQICHTFGLDIDKDVVRRVLAKHYRPDDSGCDGPRRICSQVGRGPGSEFFVIRR